MFTDMAGNDFHSHRFGLDSARGSAGLGWACSPGCLWSVALTFGQLWTGGTDKRTACLPCAQACAHGGNLRVFKDKRVNPVSKLFKASIRDSLAVQWLRFSVFIVVARFNPSLGN